MIKCISVRMSLRACSATVLMNMPDKTKDGPKARKDLKYLNIREDLHMLPRKKLDETETKTVAREKKGKKIKTEDNCPPSCFTLSQAEINAFFKCLTRYYLLPLEG